MLGDALAFPRQNDDWVRNVLIGGVLVLLSFLLVPVFLVYGYLARVLRASSRGDPTAPDFDEWGDLFVEGVTLVVVSLVYLVVPLVLTVLFAAVVGALTLDFESVGGGGPAGILGLLAVLVIPVVWLLGVYLLPAAMTNVARERSFGAAFDVDALGAAAGSGDYFVAVLLAVVVSLVLGAIAGLLTVVLVGVFVSFYVQVVVFYLFGRGFGEAVSSLDGDPTEAPSETAETPEPK